MDDEPLFIIAPKPPMPMSARSNRLGARLAILAAVLGLAVGFTLETALNHRHSAPTIGVTATASK